MSKRGGKSDAAFKDALKLHQTGRLGDARSLYRRILDNDPIHSGAHYFLGMMASDEGDLAAAAKLMERALDLDPDQALRQNILATVYQRLGRLVDASERFKRAIDIDPDFAEAHLNLGILYHIDGRIEDATECYRCAVEADPDLVKAHYNLALGLRDTGRLDEAALCFGRAIELDADCAAAHEELGAVYRQQGRLEDAAISFGRTCDLSPDNADAHGNLGAVLHNLRRTDEALVCFERAVELAPEDAKTHNNLGLALKYCNQIEPAVASFQCAIELDPNFAKAHSNLGVVLQRLGLIDDAVVAYQRALTIAPSLAKVHTNLATILHKRNMLDEAIVKHKDALALDPDDPEVHLQYSETLLYTGHLAGGWAEYEWRWKQPEFKSPRASFPAPSWDGADPSGRTVLVWAEQGVGDEIMFASMLPDLIALGAHVILECDSRMVPLFERSTPAIECLPRSDPPSQEATRDDIDFQVSCGSLGQWFREDFESFPDRQVYLVADGDLRSAIRARYGAGDGTILVGIAWYSKNVEIGTEKSMALSDWRGILITPGVRFVDLQYGDTAAERAGVETETGVRILHDDAVDQMANLDAFAAQVAAMDLVITISNTTAHMAGALGVPVWILLSAVPMWRWFQGCENSPWYPSARLFRQAQAGEWVPAINSVVAALRRHLEDLANKDEN